MKHNILIFGSMSPVKVPDIKIDEIFTSNGSAELASLYKQKITNVPHTCVIGARSFTKLDHIKTRVIKAKPDKLIIRDYQKVYTNIKENFYNNILIKKFSLNDQFLFQADFFNGGLLNLIKAEMKYEKSFFRSLLHIFYCLYRDGFIGVSTGFFSLLYAAKKYPNSNLILSGISFKGGDHYYKSGKMSLNRGSVDNYLIKLLRDNIKSRIFCMDNSIALDLGIKHFSGKVLSL